MAQQYAARLLRLGSSVSVSAPRGEPASSSSRSMTSKEGGEHEHGAPVGQGPGQAVEKGLLVGPLEALEAEGGAAAVARDALEAEAVPRLDADRRVEGEARVFPGQHVLGRGSVEAGHRRGQHHAQAVSGQRTCRMR